MNSKGNSGETVSKTFEERYNSPSVTLSSPPARQPQPPIPINITFVEPVNDFDVAEHVSNGTKSNITGTRKDYQIDITPSEVGM